MFHDTVTLPTGLEAHLDELRALARRLSGSAEDAEDLVQETAAAALSSLDRLRHPELLGAWLHQILRRRWYDLLRRRVLERRHPAPAPGEVPAAGPGDPDPVHATLARLEPEERRLLELRFFEQQTPARIAARLGRPAATVRSLIFRALKRFETLFPEQP